MSDDPRIDAMKAAISTLDRDERIALSAAAVGLGDELQTVLDPLLGKLLAVADTTPTHRHRKGALYRLIGYAHHTEEIAAAVAVYADSSGVLWARPAAMFDDGRFTPIGEDPAP